jgi:hypothetical protein
LRIPSGHAAGDGADCLLNGRSVSGNIVPRSRVSSTQIVQADREVKGEAGTGEPLGSDDSKQFHVDTVTCQGEYSGLQSESSPP